MAGEHGPGVFVPGVMELLPVEERQHMHRVGILAGLFVETLQIHGLFPAGAGLHGFYGRAAKYHDIGKVWLPRSILTKTQGLTREEAQIMREHPVLARWVFEQIRESAGSRVPGPLMQLLTECAVYHHEWWNGSGYPYGLSGAAIPLGARVTAICDAYDAMTSNRAYRAKNSRGYARRELDKNAGIQFDPHLVRAFLDLEIEFAAHPGTLASAL